MDTSLLKSVMFRAGEIYHKSNNFDAVLVYISKMLGINVGRILDNKDYYLVHKAQCNQGWLELCDKEFNYVASSRSFPDDL